MPSESIIAHGYNIIYEIVAQVPVSFYSSFVAFLKFKHYIKYKCITYVFHQHNIVYYYET